MKTIESISQIRQELSSARVGKKVALVPTMGCLHEGHIALVQKAREVADIVVVSIFVNQLQFNNSEDFEKYPRTFRADEEILKKHNVDFLFAPAHQEMYKSPASFKIIPGELSNFLCGASRPGHFEGVCFVVSKLFNIVKPEFAVFGKKDFQQLAIIKKLNDELNFGIEIIGLDTIRSEIGLALSSRNKRLSDASLLKAEAIFKALTFVQKEFNSHPSITKLIEEGKKIIFDNGFSSIDYFDIRYEDDLSIVSDNNSQKKKRVFVAATIDNVRLIDNLEI